MQVVRLRFIEDRHESFQWLGVETIVFVDYGLEAIQLPYAI
jgi:hypothetical protein